MTTEFVTGIADHKDSFEAGKQAAQQAKNKLKADQPDIAILFCSAHYDYAAVMKGIQQVIGDKPLLIGCTSAGQFTSEEFTKEGVACGLISSSTHQFFSGMGTQLKDNPLASLQDAVVNFPKANKSYPYQSAILLMDGLVGKGEETVLAASSLLGPLVKFAGGAAADNFHFKETAVFGQDQALSNAVSLCLVNSRSPISIAFKHGHYPISPSLKVTKAKDNVLYEIEGKPAFEVWKDYVRVHLKARKIDVDHLSLDDLSKSLLKYEVGLMIGNDYKIRFPVSCNADGSLNFVCSILEGAVIKIMDSHKEDQIQLAQEAAKLALESSKGRLAGALVFDCACRSMILKNQFSQSIQAIKNVLGSVPLLGCETYGEIAMQVGQLSGFHNTTTVIMLFPA